MNSTYKFRGNTLEILKLLGKGKGGYSYLVTDGKQQYVCKQIHHETTKFYDFGDEKFNSEIVAYEKLRQLPLNLPKLLEVNHEQEYLIKEYIAGDLITDLAASGQIQTEHFIQAFKISEASRKSEYNLDYFPSNFIVDEHQQLYYIDYEINEYMKEWGFSHWGIYYWLNQEGMRLFIENGSYDLLHPDPNKSKPRTIGFENRVAELKALYQRSKN
jgi:serine/threonine protein kinase